MGIEDIDYWFDRIIECGEKGKALMQEEFTLLEKENEKLRTMYAKVQKILLLDEVKDALNREAAVKPIEITITRDAEKPRTRIDKIIYNPDGSVQTLYGLSFKTGEWIEIPEGETCLEEMVWSDE